MGKTLKYVKDFDFNVKACNYECGGSVQKYAKGGHVKSKRYADGGAVDNAPAPQPQVPATTPPANTAAPVASPVAQAPAAFFGGKGKWRHNIFAKLFQRLMQNPQWLAQLQKSNPAVYQKFIGQMAQNTENTFQYVPDWIKERNRQAQNANPNSTPPAAAQPPAQSAQPAADAQPPVAGLKRGGRVSRAVRKSVPVSSQKPMIAARKDKK